MSLHTRRSKIFKKRNVIYLFLLVLLISLPFLFYLVFLKNAAVISPLSKQANFTNIEEILKEKQILFSSVTLLNSTYTVNIPNSGQVMLSSQKNINKQISSLQRILHALTIEGKPFKSIDLRFNEPTIVF